VAIRRIVLAVLVTASTAGFLLAGCDSAAPGSPTAATTTSSSSESAPPTVVATVTAPPPVTVTATPKPPVTVTEQAPVIIAPQQDPTTVYQYSPAYTSVFDLPSGLYCRDLKAMGYSYSQATSYWYYHGRPAMMDADLNGIPCETVY